MEMRTLDLSNSPLFNGLPSDLINVLESVSKLGLYLTGDWAVEMYYRYINSDRKHRESISMYSIKYVSTDDSTNLIPEFLESLGLNEATSIINYEVESGFEMRDPKSGRHYLVHRDTTSLMESSLMKLKGLKVVTPEYLFKNYIGDRSFMESNRKKILGLLHVIHTLNRTDALETQLREMFITEEQECLINRYIKLYNSKLL